MIAIVPSRAPTSVGAAAAPGQVTENEVATGGDAVRPCEDRPTPQVAGDPYAPPCLRWTGGDNGGETTRGVTASEIVVSYRDDGTAAEVAAGLPGMAGGPDLTRGTGITETMGGLVEFFNANFQFYGRKLRLEVYKGSANPMNELMGGGQQGAEADAVRAAEEIRAFADVSGTPTQPYAAALASRQVLALAVPSLSTEFFAARRPYVWSFMPSCTTTTRAASEFLAKALAGRPARFAGDPALRGQVRKIAIITPENEEYRNCTEAGLAVLRAAGADAVTLTYPLDLGNLPRAAEDLLNRLRGAGITTVGMAGDPLLPMHLSKAATTAGFRPEWVMMGNALSDNDALSSLYDQAQWAHAFGVTVTGQPVPLQRSPAYAAFKRVRPDQEPSPVVDAAFYQLYLLAIGIQMAGPQLTPASFERGMLAYPEHSGPGGTWRFGPGKFDPQVSASVIWWDAEGQSPLTGGKGTYRHVGQPYRIGDLPAGEPAVFGP
jgi:hypothetical protein